jgi:hypothetical protein
MENSVSKQHFKNLLSIAYADGILDKAELDFIFEKSGKYYISSEDIDGIIENSMRPALISIADEAQRSQMMLDLIQMMCLDSEINENQLRCCSIFGVSMGYDGDTIESLVSTSTAMLEDGKDDSSLLSHIQSFH